MPSGDPPKSRPQRLDGDRLFPKGFWARPNVKDREIGDTNNIRLYYAVGLALSCWEQGQNTLSHLFMTMMSIKDGRGALAAHRLFGSIESIPAKVTAIEKIAEVFFDVHWSNSLVKQPVTALISEIKRGGQLRNEIAHGTVNTTSRIGRDDSGEQKTENGGWLLTAPQYMTGRNNLYPNFESESDLFGITTSMYRFNSSDVISFAERFNKLHDAMIDLSSKMFVVPEFSLPKLVVEAIYPDFRTP